MKLAVFVVVLAMLFPAYAGQDLGLVPIFGDKIPFQELNEYDKLILATCGDWGEKVKKSSLQSMFRDPVAQSYVAKIYGNVDKRVIGKQEISQLQFVDELIALLAGDAFQHIFCGTPYNRSSDPGLHYFARLQQLQQKGLVGLDTNCDISAYEDGAYTIGTVFVKNDGTTGIKCPQSFVGNMHADELMIAMIRGYRQSVESGRITCFYKSDDPSVGGDFYFKIIAAKKYGNKLISFFVFPNAPCPGASCVMCNDK